MTTYTSQPDETSGIDTHISDAAPTTNYGTSDEIVVGELATVVQTNRSLIKFDLSSIPSGATISSAVLSLWTKTDYATDNSTFKVHRVKRNWVEAQATWNIYSTGNNWGTAGADHADDFDSTEHASRAFSATETIDAETQFTFDATGLTELKKMIDGTYTNYGWIVRGLIPETANAGYTFHSSSGTTAGYRPKLVIEYTAPPPSSGFFAFF